MPGDPIGGGALEFNSKSQREQYHKACMAQQIEGLARHAVNLQTRTQRKDFIEQCPVVMIDGLKARVKELWRQKNENTAKDA